MKERKKISPLEALKQSQETAPEIPTIPNLQEVTGKAGLTSFDKNTIQWSKWRCPFGDNFQEEEWPGAINPSQIIDEYGEELEYDDDDPIDDIPVGRHLKLMQTPIGILPMTEHSNPAKIFNFWQADTNFPVTRYIVSIINKIPGIEILNVFTRYRFRIGIGKLFKDRDVMHELNCKVADHLGSKKKQEATKCPIKFSGEMHRRKAN